MKIIVCLKQVPETTEIKIDPETNTLIREGVNSIINPFDLYALEEGLRIKERQGGEVIALSMGPPQAEAVLKEAISLGADEGILLTDRAFAGSDTLATSYILATAIRKVKEFDLIICGKQALDGDTGQVGPGIAQTLEVPFITYVRKIEEISTEKIRAERMMEEGYEVIETSLPALITVVKEINEPRLPSLRGKMRARKYTPIIWGKRDLEVAEGKIGLRGSPTRVIKIFTPPPRPGGIILKGTKEEVVEKLSEIIKKI